MTCHGPGDEDEEGEDPAAWRALPPGDCLYENGKPHRGEPRRVEYMCVHEHWTGNVFCDGHLEDPEATWWPCGRCAHDGGRCPSVVRVIGTGRLLRFPGAVPVV
jgi:hypothetical protein